MDSPKVRRMPCPPSSSWPALAAGAITGPEGDRLLAHASECPDCAQSLHSAEALFQDADDAEPTPGPDPDMQALARRMADVHRPSHRPWAAAAVAAALLLVAAGSFFYLRPPAPPLAQLAAAYANPRTLEFRVAGAPYAALQVRRGRQELAPASPELLESQAAILRATANGNAGSGWLHAKGRADLLRGNFNEAIQTLESAAGLESPSAELSIDLGIAFASRAAAGGSAQSDYERAVELFSAALSRDPRNPAALFNRALAHSRLLHLDSAIRDLETCLTLETDQGWRAEAQTLLEQLRKRRAQAFSPPRPLPEALQAEAAFDQTLRDGLPATATASLAPILLQRHNDAWLRAAAGYAASNGPLQPSIQTLAAMARIRAKSRREEYAALSDKIRILAAAALPEPLAAWREFELLFSRSNRNDKAACLTQLNLPATFQTRRYQWFAIQAALELSTCKSALGNLDAAARSTSNALDWAKDASYGTAYIRAQGFLSSHLANEGRYRESVSLSLTALQAILDGQYPLDRGFQFYRNLAVAASRLERWESARAATEMSVAVAHHTGLTTIEMLSRITQAEFSLRTGDRDGARAQLQIADQLAGKLNLDPDVAAMRSFSQAFVHAVDNNYAAALAAEPQVLAVRNLFLDARYLSMLAELDLRHQRPAAARDHATEAIRRISAVREDARRFRDYDARAARSLVRAHLRLGDYPAALHAWRDWLRRDRDLLGGRRTVDAPLSGTTLTIVPLDPDIAVFTETATGITFHWANVNAAQGLTLVRRLRLLCSNYRSDPAIIRSVSRELLAGLVGADNPVLQQPTLHLESPGEWASVPLLALFDGAPAFRMPSPAREGCRPPDAQLALVHAGTIGAEFQAALPPLPGLDQEAELLRAALPHTDRISGPAATARNIAAAASRYRWLHFSGHAVRLGQTALLVTAPDAAASEPDQQRGLWRLRPSERLCSELIFFAACSTGMFEDLDTIAPAQLADAAILAGARTAIASLWDVDSQATSHLTAQFYAALRTGASPSQSLRTAAHSLRSNPKYQHPYYWAAFVVFEA